jgi:hypothetical protein
MLEPDLKALKERWGEDLLDQIHLDLTMMERKAWFGSDFPNGSNPIEKVAYNVLKMYTGDLGWDSLSCLYADGFTPKEASSIIIEYYEVFWIEEKTSGDHVGDAEEDYM